MAGLVYVKRDMSHEEAPRTFSKEEGNVLDPWVKWADKALSTPVDDPLPPSPATRPKGVSDKARSSARNAFLVSLNSCGCLPVDRHMEVVSALSPALGWPWEGADGSVYVAPLKSWLSESMPQSSQPSSGWIEWATAAMRLMGSQQATGAFLPSKTIIDPWTAGEERSNWLYGALDCWWQASYLSTSPKAEIAQVNSTAFQRWSILVQAIDQRMHASPSPLGLPLHWQVAARQAEKCLLSAPAEPLIDIGGALPPIHSEIKIGSKATHLWMGAAEWAMLRFTRMVQETKRWPVKNWEGVRAVMEEDLRSRGPSSMKLMDPFRQGLLKAVEGIKQMEDSNGVRRAVPDTSAIQSCKAELDAWWIEAGTPLAQQPSSTRSRRL